MEQGIKPRTPVGLFQIRQRTQQEAFENARLVWSFVVLRNQCSQCLSERIADGDIDR